MLADLRIKAVQAFLPQFRLLGRGPFRRLFLARVGSSFGNWLAYIALLVVIYDQTGSAHWVAAVAVAYFLPGVLVGLLASHLVDLLPRKRTLVISDLVNVAVFCTLPWVSSASMMIGLIVISGFASALFRPALYASLPYVLKGDEELARGTALLSSSEMVANLLGPVLSGVLFALLGPTVLYLVDAGTYLFSALMIMTLASSSLQGERVAQAQSRLAEASRGLVLIATNKRIRGLVLTWGPMAAVLYTTNVASIVLARTVLGAGSTGYGIMVAASGAGLAVGALLVGALNRQDLIAVFRWFALGLGLTIGLTALSPTVFVAVLFYFVAGVFNGGCLVCLQTLVQQLTAPEVRGRVFIGFGSLVQLFAVIGLISGGSIVEVLGGRWSWVFAGSVTVTLSLLTWWLVPAREEESALAVSALEPE